MRGDVAQRMRQIFLDVPGEVAHEKRHFLGKLRVALHPDFPKGGLLAGGQAWQQKWRDRDFELARRIGKGRGHFARGLHGEGEAERPHVEGGGASRVSAQALECERGRAQHVIEGAHHGLRKGRAYSLNPRCKATTPRARLKYSTRAKPTS